MHENNDVSKLWIVLTNLFQKQAKIGARSEEGENVKFARIQKFKFLASEQRNVSW